MNIFKVIKAAVAQVREERAKVADVNERYNIALAFNTRYTYGEPYFPESDERLPGTAIFGVTPKAVAAWMCPRCNDIHKPVSCSSLSGIQFPACCNISQGHRQYYDIHATTPSKRK